LDRDEVVAHVELHARVLECLESAFIGGELFGIRALRTQKPAQHQQGDAQAGGYRKEQKDRQIFAQHARFLTLRPVGASGPPTGCSGGDPIDLVPKGGLEPPRLSSLPPQGSASTNSATWALARFRHTGTQPRNCTSGSTVLVAVFGIRSCGFGIGGGNL